MGCCLSLLLTCGISSYLVGIIDAFVNEFGILLLICIQCIIFAWFYGVEHFIPALNENSSFKVGRIWSLIIKYLLPCVLILLWVVGIYNLFSTARTFELVVDVIIMVGVLVFAIILTRLKPAGE